MCPPWAELEEVAAARGCEVTRLVLSRSLDWDGVRRITTTFAAWRPDIVHTHLLLSDVYAAVARRLTRSPLLVSTVQGLNYLWRLEPGVARRLRYWLCASLYRGVYASFDAVVTCSAALREAICRGPGLRVARGKTSVIHNAIDVRTVEAAGAALPSSPVPRIVSVANFEPVKGHAVLIRALALLGSEFPVRCLLVGDGPLRPRMERLARELGVADRVAFLGQRADVAAIVRSCDLFVLSSLWEGLGISMLEAMALGVPVVACNAGGVPEVVEDGVTGVLVHAGDPRALAAGVRRGLADEELRRRVIPNARRLVAARFDAADMVAAYERWYEGLAQAAGVAPA